MACLAFIFYPTRTIGCLHGENGLGFSMIYFTKGFQIAAFAVFKVVYLTFLNIILITAFANNSR